MMTEKRANSLDSQRTGGSPADFSITFKIPQKHLSKTAYCLYKLNAKLVQNLGHYEILFGDFDRDILDVYRHIVELQRHNHIPPALKIARITAGPHTM